MFRNKKKVDGNFPKSLTRMIMIALRLSISPVPNTLTRSEQFGYFTPLNATGSSRSDPSIWLWRGIFDEDLLRIGGKNWILVSQFWCQRWVRVNIWICCVHLNILRWNCDAKRWYIRWFPVFCTFCARSAQSFCPWDIVHFHTCSENVLVVGRRECFHRYILFQYCPVSAPHLWLLLLGGLLLLATYDAMVG